MPGPVPQGLSKPVARPDRAARAVLARALDADQGDRPEPAQPAQQVGASGRGSRELPAIRDGMHLLAAGPVNPGLLH